MAAHGIVILVDSRRGGNDRHPRFRFRGNTPPFARTTEKPLIQQVSQVVLIVVGVLLWLVNNYIPMQRSIKSILNAVVVIAVVLWLLSAFGLLTSLSRIHVGK